MLRAHPFYPRVVYSTHEFVSYEALELVKQRITNDAASGTMSLLSGCDVYTSPMVEVRYQM